MCKKLSILLALLYAVPTIAQTSATSATPGIVSVTVPLQVIAPVGCTVAFSSAGTVPVTTVENCPGPAPVSTAPPPPIPTPPPDPPPPPPPTPTPSSSPAAFPGAQGSAASSLGGRGGAAIEVTNLNDAGPGSLRACVMASAPRTCIFRVAGLFPVTSADLRFSSPFLTVAGQTAPGEVILGGPNTGGALFGVSTHDVILRYVTLSPDNFNTPSGPDTGTTSIWIVNCPGNGSKTTGGCYNVMIDHVTTRWSGNKSWITTSNFTPGGKNANGSGPNHDITTQWSLDYEPHEGHPVGFGTATDETCVGTRANGNCLSPYEVNIDFHHNLLVNVHHRIPENSNGSTRWINNVIFNWGWYANEWLGAEIIDAINNKYITGNLNSGAQAFPIHFTTNSPEMSGAPSVYVAGNIFGGHGANTVNSDQYGQLVNQITGENGNETGAIPGSWARPAPMPASNAFPIIADPAANLDAVLLPTVGNSQHLDCDGNWVSHRDPADTRIIAQYQSGGSGGYWPNAVTFTGQATIPQPTADWQDSAVVNGTPCVESLHDGIPDQWKKNHNLSATNPNLYKTVDAKTGYTYLEEYLAGNGTVMIPPVPPSPPTPAAPPSPSGTIVTPASNTTIVDAQANSWTLGPAVPVVSNADCAPNSCGSVVLENGTSQNGTAAALLLWLNNALYQANAAGNWWTWDGSAWKKATGDPRSAAPTP
jgi:pectate lyase